MHLLVFRADYGMDISLPTATIYSSVAEYRVNACMAYFMVTANWHAFIHLFKAVFIKLGDIEDMPCVVVNQHV